MLIVNKEDIKNLETAEDHLKFLLKIGWEKDSIIIREFCKKYKLKIE